MLLRDPDPGDRVSGNYRTCTNDNTCNGLSYASAASAPNCAKRTIGDPNGALFVADGDGDTIKLQDGQVFNEQVTITQGDPNLTIQAYSANPTVKPTIGGRYLRFSSGDDWEEDPNNPDPNLPVYRTIDTFEETDIPTIGVVRAAWIEEYVDPNLDLNYENERIGLIPYEDEEDTNLGLDELRSGNYFWNPIIPGADPNIPGAPFYRGPGIYYDHDDDHYYIRLGETPQQKAYQENVARIFLTDANVPVYNPNEYVILIGRHDYTLRINASNVTIRNVRIEANKRSVELCNNVDPNVSNTLAGITFDRVKVWSGNDGAIVTSDNNNCAAVNAVTIKDSQIFGDIPYWVSWIDCKEGPQPCTYWRYSLIGHGTDDDADEDLGANGWLVTRNHIRGGHDGIGIDGDSNGLVYSYNRLENLADDAFELEAQDNEVVGRIDIYGNYIGNSLTCASIGQDSDESTWSGPIHFNNNICALIRPQHVNSGFSDANTPMQCAGVDWNGGFCYGGEYALKFGDEEHAAPDHNVNIYNNTIVAGLTDPTHGDPNNLGKGLNITGQVENTGKTTGRIFNNILMTVNDRVGEYEMGIEDPNTGWTEIDYDLYFSMNNPAGHLADIA